MVKVPTLRDSVEETEMRETEPRREAKQFKHFDCKGAHSI